MKNKISIKKIILTILGCFILIIGISAGSLYLTVTSMNKVYSPKEVVLKGGEKQALLIYEPSKSSLNEKVALKAADVMQQNGYTVTINYPSDELNYDLEKYDLIAFGSPVYAQEVSPVLKDYIRSNKVENKKILLYSVGKFSDKTDELAKLKACVAPDNNIEAEKYTESTEDVFLDYIKKCI